MDAVGAQITMSDVAVAAAGLEFVGPAADGARQSESGGGVGATGYAA